MVVNGPRWWCLQHVAFEGPAAIATALAARGIAVRTCRLDLGDALPAGDEVDGLVIMGGPMGALDDDDHPYLPGERALIAACAGRDAPILGVCLGAQLLAAALGADVYRGPLGEVGAGTVRRTPAGELDPMFGAWPHDDIPVVHWHHDTFDLPPGALLLASSERYPHQAFRVGRAYGLQFHVELGPADRSILADHMNPARLPTVDELAEVEAVGRILLERFADLSIPS